MGWSWRIGRIAGIDVHVHLTFLLLLAWVGIEHYTAHGELGEAVGGLAFILALFGIVVLHELGHALTARRFGIRTRDIILLPIGGVARLERMPDDPRQELLVALAGPAVNLVLASGIYVVLALGEGLSPVGEALRVGGDFLEQLFWVNISLALFNLLPAFPMDGGRVLRALLALRMDRVRATEVAARIGQSIALLLAFLGLFFNPMLIFIGLFVWLGAAEESSMVQMRSAMDGIPVTRVMITDFRTLRPDDPLAKAIEFVKAGIQQDFPVVEDGRLVGVLTRNDLLTGLGRRGAEARVGDVMQRDFIAVDPHDTLRTALAGLKECDCRTLPVVQHGRLIGLVTADQLAEVLMIQQAARGEHRRRHGPEATDVGDHHGATPRFAGAASFSGDGKGHPPSI
jgi:Zn-dependent protease/predicted transcriptional regulator